MRVATPTVFRRRRGFTLIEVLVASSIAGLAIGGCIYGYVMTSKRAEWSAYSLAAQSSAMQRLEQTRAAKWDTLPPDPTDPAADQLKSTNFPAETVLLDIPLSKTNYVYGTNFTTITTVSTNPPLRMVRVDCTWKFIGHEVYTNTLVTYRAPDQ